MDTRLQPPDGTPDRFRVRIDTNPLTGGAALVLGCTAGGCPWWLGFDDAADLDKLTATADAHAQNAHGKLVASTDDRIRFLVDLPYQVLFHPRSDGLYGVTVADMGEPVAESVQHPTPQAALAAVYEQVRR